MGLVEMVSLLPFLWIFQRPSEESKPTRRGEVIPFQLLECLLRLPQGVQGAQR